MLADKIRMRFLNAGPRPEDIADENCRVATDEDFSGTADGEFKYIGTATSLVIPHIIKGVKVTSYADMFYWTPHSSLEVRSNNTRITNMNSMFRECFSLTSLDLSTFDTSNVTNMGNMFQSSWPLTSLNLSNFDTSNVTSMSSMFGGCESLTSLDLSSFDTSNVTSMSNMFNYCLSLTSLDLSRFDTSKVINMSYMFYYCPSLTSLDLSSFDTSNVTDMSGMFRNSQATTLDLSSFDTSNVTSMLNTFRDSSATTGYARTQADADRFNNSSNKPAGLTFVAVRDVSGSPGPKILIAGSMEEGFFGEVPASELINGDELASVIGLSAGTPHYTNEPYLKFAYEGKILFVAKKTFRYNLTWDDINWTGAVDGKTISIGEKQYKVRLFRGALTNPSNNALADKGAIGSEWNKLMLPITINAKDNSWGKPENVESNVPYWGIDYTNEDLHSHYSLGKGTFSICQENEQSRVDYYISRGFYDVSGLLSYFRSNTASGNNGWRPVLELIE